MSFSTISFLKCPQFCEHDPGPVIGAGRLGAVTAPHPAPLPLSPAGPHPGWGPGRVLSNKLSHIRSLNISFLKCSQSFVHEPDPVSRAGRLGAVAAPYPASSPPPQPGRPRSGMCMLGGGEAAAPDVSCLTCTALVNLYLPTYLPTQPASKICTYLPNPTLVFTLPRICH